MKKIILFVTILLFFSFETTVAQFYEETRLSGVENPLFNVQIFRTISDNLKSGKLYVYSNIINDDLTFLKNDSIGGFQAEFEWEVAVEDEEKQVAFHSIHKEVYEVDYNQTNDREKNILLSTTFDIPAGEYVITAQIRDLMSKKSVSRKIEMEMYDLNKESIDMSDILFLNEAEFDSVGNLTHFVPRVKNNFSRHTPFIYIYTEIYSKEYPAIFNIRYRLEDVEGEVELDTVIFKEMTGPLSSYVFKLDKRMIAKNNHQCSVILSRGSEQVERFRNISFYWVNVPETSEDITLALRQMRYISPLDSLDIYLEAPLEEQQKFFSRFWARRDPNPETEANELMEEYFSRLNFANREFSNYIDDGWLSDRGRILIKFGYPDDVESYPLGWNSIPYVIWRYYFPRAKVFVFADRMGFGDYRLLPEYQSEEYN